MPSSRVAHDAFCKIEADCRRALQCVTTNDAPGFLAACNDVLHKSNFQVARAALVNAGVGCLGFVNLVLKALLAIANKGLGEYDKALPFLLVELGPGLLDATTADNIPELSAAACMTALQLAKRGENARIVPKLLGLWRVGDSQVDEEQVFFAGYIRKLVELQEWTVVVGLLCDFPSLRATAGELNILLLLARGCRDQNGMEAAAAERLALELGADAKVTLVEECLAVGYLRTAAQFAKKFGLEARYPDVEILWRSHALAKALETGRREAAIGLSMDQPKLHQSCVDGLLVMGEVELAVELSHAWCVPLTSPPDLAFLEERRSMRAATYLQPPAFFRTEVVDLVAQLSSFHDTLLGSRRVNEPTIVVGLDVEWRPVKDAPPSLLQLAIMDRAYIIDLLALGASAVLGETLSAVFGADYVTLVGCDIGKDLGRIGAALPALANSCDCAVRKAEDVRTIYASKMAKQTGASKKKCMEGVSLSSLAERVLGQPLDKVMQMSDWARRPLSAAQVSYASLDAWVPVLLHAKLIGCSEAKG